MNNEKKLRKFESEVDALIDEYSWQELLGDDGKEKSEALRDDHVLRIQKQQILTWRLLKLLIHLPSSTHQDAAGIIFRAKFSRDQKPNDENFSYDVLLTLLKNNQDQEVVEENIKSFEKNFKHFIAMMRTENIDGIREW